MSIFKPAYIQHVMTTQVRRNAAAERAYRTLQFIKYHNAFYDNRHRSIQAIFDSSGEFSSNRTKWSIARNSCGWPTEKQLVLIWMPTEGWACIPLI